MFFPKTTSLIASSHLTPKTKNTFLTIKLTKQHLPNEVLQKNSNKLLMTLSHLSLYKLFANSTIPEINHQLLLPPNTDAPL